LIPITNPKKSNHYVDNKKLHECLSVWKVDVEKAKKKKLPRTQWPPIPDFAAECFLKMATRLSFKPGFRNYTFREDMIGDALENCLLYIHNFDPDRPNVFAYVAQIMHNAFIRRIQKEGKQLYVKMKVIENSDVLSSYMRQEGDHTIYDNTYVEYLQDNMGDIIQNFEERKNKKRKKAKEKANLNGMLEEAAVV